MAAVSYDWYVSQYGGSLEEAAFSRLSQQGFLFADALTGGRLSAVWAQLPEGVKNAVSAALCAYAEQASMEESGGVVQSENNDGLSRSYAVSNAASKTSNAACDRLADAVRGYLASTGLLYRGRGRRV